MTIKLLLSTVAIYSFATASSAAPQYSSTGYYQPVPAQTTTQSSYGNGYNQPSHQTQSQYTQPAPRYAAPVQQQTYQPTQQPKYAAPRYVAPAQAQPKYTQPAPRYAAPAQAQQQYRAPQPAPRYAAPAQAQPQYTQPAPRYAAPVQAQQPNYAAPATTQPYQGAIGTEKIKYDNEVFSPKTKTTQPSQRSAASRTPSSAASSAQSPISLGAQFGTLGLGAEVSYEVNDSFTLRGNPSIGTFSYNDNTEAGINYDADFDLVNLGVLADWHPMKNGFRVTGGLFFSGDEIELKGKNANQIVINNVNYNTSQVQSVTADVEYDVVQPYLGIGYTGGLSPKSKWELSVDVGAKYIGDADVSSFTAVADPNFLTSTPAFDNDLEQERLQLEDSLSDFNFYPVIMVGAKYRF